MRKMKRVEGKELNEEKGDRERRKGRHLEKGRTKEGKRESEREKH